MKIRHVWSATITSVCAFGLASCANQQGETSTTTSNANPGSRTYGSEDLQQTGKRTSAEQLQAADPSVTTTTGGR
jgi:hypothetical protein